MIVPQECYETCLDIRAAADNVISHLEDLPPGVAADVAAYVAACLTSVVEGTRWGPVFQYVSGKTEDASVVLT